MKKKNRIFMIIGFVFIMMIVIVYILTKNQTEYTLSLSKEVDSFSSVILEQNGDARTIKSSENIQNIIDKLVGIERITYEESIQDVPIDMEEEILITLNAEKVSTLFVYKRKNKYYIEQPYNGIYEITKEEYQDIYDFYQGLREEVTNLEKTSLTNRVNKLAPADQLGKSFQTSDLTNDELLRLGFGLFGPVQNFGFIDITFEDLNRTYIKGYFGREDVSPQDITCSCGKVISTYNTSNDTFTWDTEFHYLSHKSNVYNEIKDMYKIEDRYIVKVYKIFSDIMMNSSTTQYRFYSTYQDAVLQENVLFTVANESEFTNALESLDDSKKTLYTLTFEKNGTFKLIDYEINDK